MKPRLLLSLLFFFAIFDFNGAIFADQDQKKLIVVFSNPRSLSTPFMRMMEARGDCFISSEPGRLFREKAEDIVQSYCQKYSFVCIKEMGANARKWLLGGELEEFFLEHAQCIFLVRNPHKSLMSFYRVLRDGYDSLDQASLDSIKNYVPLGHDSLPDYWDDFFDYKKLYDMHNSLLENATHKPVVIEADDLVHSPELTVRTMCKKLDIPFDASCLQWEPLSLSSNSYDREVICKLYYKNALQSTCFSKQSNGSFACDTNGEPTFEEIANLKHREQLIQLYRKNMPFYEKFVNVAQ